MSTVQSVDRAIDILEVVAGGGRGVRDIASKTSIPKSAVHRLLETLGHHQLLTKQEDGGYRLGPTLLRLGMAYLQDIDVRSKAIPHMTALRDFSNETVGLSVRLGDERLYIEQIESRLELKLKAEVGRPYPLYCGAPGRVILASMSDGEIDAYLDRVDLVPLTGHTPRTKDRIWQLIDVVREAGYAVATGETMSGLSTIATPVRGHTGEVAAALSICGPESRFGPQQRHEVLPALLNATATLSEELGFCSDLGRKSNLDAKALIVSHEG